MPAERQNVVLVYPVSSDRGRILMQFSKDPDDPSYNRFNGLSAWPKARESLSEAARRALRTAGITTATLQFRGTIHWSRFDPDDWPLFGHLFLADLPSRTGIVMEAGLVRREWINVDDLFSDQVPCWPGDLHTLPLVLDDNPQPIQAVMVYDNGVPTQWRFERT